MSPQSDQLFASLNICASLSLVSSLVICLKYFYFPSLRSRSAKLVLWLSLSNIGLCITILCGIDQNRLQDYEVNLYSFLLNYFMLSNMFWSVSIARTMEFVILQRNKLLTLLSQRTVQPTHMASKRMIYFHVFVIGGCCVLSIIPIITNSYVRFNEQWYWYGDDELSQGIAALCYYGPLLIGFGYNAYVLCSMIQVKTFFQDTGMNLSDNQTLTGQLYELAMSLKNYPIVTSLISMWAIVVEIDYLICKRQFSPNRFWLQLSLAVLQSSQGIFHVMIYFYRSYRRGTLWSKDEGLCGLCCDNSAIERGIVDMDSNGDIARQLSLTAQSSQALNKAALGNHSNSSSRNHSGGSSSTNNKSAPAVVDVERSADMLLEIYNIDKDRLQEVNAAGQIDAETLNILASRAQYSPPSLEQGTIPRNSGTTNTTNTNYAQSNHQYDMNSNSDYSMNAIRPSQMTLGPNPNSVSVRIGDEESNNGSKISINTDVLEMISGSNSENSFGVCLED